MKNTQTKSIGRGQTLETHVGNTHKGDAKIGNKNKSAKGGSKGSFGGGPKDLSRTLGGASVPGRPGGK